MTLIRKNLEKFSTGFHCSRDSASSRMMVDRTGIEPVTSSMSTKRSTAELTVRVAMKFSGTYSRWRRDLNPCTRLCRPLPRLSATPPHTNPDSWILRADDRVRTGDLNLGKVPRYQLRYVRKADAIYRRWAPCPKPGGFGQLFPGVRTLLLCP